MLLSDEITTSNTEDFYESVKRYEIDLSDYKTKRISFGVKTLVPENMHFS